MKLTSILFSAAIPATVLAALAGVPALPAVAFAATALTLGLAAHDYGAKRPGYGHAVPASPARRARDAALPLAA